MNWSRQRWILIASLVFVTQVACIFALHTREPLLARAAGGDLSHFPAAAAPNVDGRQLEDLTDPMLFAGAHPHGFSGAVWLIPATNDYAPSNSIPAPRFLDFERPSASPPHSPAPVEQKTPLPLLQFAIAKSAAKSTLSIEGNLTRRAPATLPEIPIQSGSDVLNRTVIEVGVQADGFPFSTRILNGSGSRGADLAGLEIARKLRFAPLPINQQRSENPLEWGELVFQWFTAEPPSTNAPVPAEVPTNASTL